MDTRRAVKFVLAASFLYAVNFNVLMSVPPVLVARSNVDAAGLVTSAHLGAAVVLQWLTPNLAARRSPRRLAVVGLALMALPSLAYLPSDPSVAALFLASMLRGAGFGVVTVLAPAMILDLSPVTTTRGRHLGLFGVATASPAVFGTALGLELLNSPWPAVAPLMASLSCIAAAVLLVLAPHLPGDDRPARHAVAPSPMVLLRMLGQRELLLLAVSFVLISIAWGGTTTYLPLALPADGPGSAATFLVISGVLRVAGRWIAGRWSDDGHPPIGSSVPVVVAMAAGLSVMALSTSAGAVVAAAIVYGLAVGLVQIFLLVAITSRSRHGSKAATALWSTSLDLGGVVGSAALAGVAAIAGYGWVLWAMPIAVVAAAPFLLLASHSIPDDRSRSTTGDRPGWDAEGHRSA